MKTQEKMKYVDNGSIEHGVWHIPN